MKICWDNLENAFITTYGNFRINNATYVERESCKFCGESYLTVKYRPSDYCSHSCSLKGDNHPQYGKKFNAEWRRKLSLAAKIRFSDNTNNPNYKGGVEKSQLPLFETFAPQIDFADDVNFIYNSNNLKLLQVKCNYCGQWFTPTINNVRNRIACLNNTTTGRTYGEGRFYCSNNCKKACPIFGQQRYPKDFKKATSREVQPELRQLVLKRDNYTCQYGACGKTTENSELHCHHIEGINLNPIESADLDLCITLCKEHHKLVHKEKGCRYVDFRCNC